METLKLQIPNTVAVNWPKNSNLEVLGSKTKLTNDQLAEVANKFKIPEYQIKESEVMAATKKGSFNFEYYHYTLSY